jgi:hypothetical protein
MKATTLLLSSALIMSFAFPATVEARPKHVVKARGHEKNKKNLRKAPRRRLAVAALAAAMVAAPVVGHAWHFMPAQVPTAKTTAEMQHHAQYSQLGPLARAKYTREYTRAINDGKSAGEATAEAMKAAQAEQAYTAAYNYGGPNYARYHQNLADGMDPAKAKAQYARDKAETAAFYSGYGPHVHNLMMGHFPGMR